MKIPITGVCKKSARLNIHTMCKMILKISIISMIVLTIEIEILMLKLSKGKLDNPEKVTSSL